ncbi:hypothetical protein ACMTN4_00115 (plasmid) [Rhodococcus globerulus]
MDIYRLVQRVGVDEPATVPELIGSEAEPDSQRHLESLFELQWW